MIQQHWIPKNWGMKSVKAVGIKKGELTVSL